MRQHQYDVYIAASPSRTIPIGVTNNLERRMWEHKLFKGFTAAYGVDRVVYMEEYGVIDAAIAREKQLKGWRRDRNVAPAKAENPRWRDLSHDWFQ